MSSLVTADDVVGCFMYRDRKVLYLPLDLLCRCHPEEVVDQGNPVRTIGVYVEARIDTGFGYARDTLGLHVMGEDDAKEMESSLV